MHSNCILDSVANLLVRHMVFVENGQKFFYSGSGVLFVLIRVSVSFSLRFVFYRFSKRFFLNQLKTASEETFETRKRLTNH